MRSRSRAFGTLLVGFCIPLFHATGILSASDELTGYPCETDVVTFNHPTKEEQSENLTVKFISNKTQLTQSPASLFRASLVICPSARRPADANCPSFSLLDLVGFVSLADNPRALRLSRSPRHYTPFRDTASARSTRPSRRAVSRHLTVSSPPAPSAFAAPARGSCPPTRAPRGRQRWPAARP